MKALSNEIQLACQFRLPQKNSDLTNFDCEHLSNSYTSVSVICPEPKKNCRFTNYGGTPLPFWKSFHRGTYNQQALQEQHFSALWIKTANSGPFSDTTKPKTKKICKTACKQSGRTEQRLVSKAALV